MIRVIIADDHDLIRNGFSGLVGKEPDITMVGEARTAAELLNLVTATRSDVIVLDISLPDRSGLDIIRDIHTRDTHTRVLVLSMHPEGRYAHRAIAVGAAGYLTKDAAADELITAIRRIHDRGRYVSVALAEELASDLSTPEEAHPHRELSDREYQLLLLIGEGRTMREAAEKLCLSINTVNSYRRRLAQKLRLQTNSELIRYVLQHNLIE